MDGLAFLSQLAHDHGAVPMPVIILTGMGNELLVVQLLQAGASDYLPKHVLSAELLQLRVRHAVAQAALQHQLETLQIQQRHSEAQLRLVWEQAPDAMVLSDAAGTVCMANPAYYALYGYGPADVLGQNFAIIFPEAARADANQHYHQSFQGPLPPAVEAHIQRADGSPRVVESRVGFLTIDGRRQAMLSVIRDITERTQLLQAAETARSAAEQATARLTRIQHITAALAEALTPQQLVDVVFREALPLLGAHAGIIVTLSADGRQLELLEQRGYAAEAVQPCERIPLDAPVPLAEVVRRATPIWLASRDEAAPRYPALQHLWNASHAWAVLPLQIEQRVVGAWGLSFAEPQTFPQEDRDVLLTIAGQYSQALERGRLYLLAEQARGVAEAAVQVRDQFLSVAAHELKNPLTALLGNTQLLERRANGGGALAPAEQRRLHTIAAQARRLNQMLTDLLDLSHLEMGQFGITRQALDLAALVATILAETQSQLTRHTLSYTPSPAPVVVLGDALRLEQVLQNLLSNAIKYSPAGGVVTVRVAPQGQRVALQVADQGVGIAAEVVPHIFQRFYRGDGRDSQRIGGTGIGLYVVSEIIRLHDGEIQVESTEGQGSTFTAWLPLAPTGANS
ncbi:MAG: PAS domain S-box protein [Chloroflexales bacterium]|nr:PAS domain S-box protein [Chloroflexales bacterium]